MVGIKSLFLDSMKKLITLVFITFTFYYNLNAQITLSHNVGSTPIKTDWESCEYEESWARTFTLSDFGISTTDQFIIRSGQIAISNSYDGAIIGIDAFIIDDDFPNSGPKHIGGGITFAPLIGDTPEIVQINFETPMVVPSGVAKILIIAGQFDDIYNPDYRKVLIAGTDQDNDTSWFKGCREYYTFTPTEDLSVPVPDANFYLNVTGEKLSMVNTSETAALSHNVADDVMKTDMFSCTSSYLYWARKFVLEDFNIGENEELVIDKGQVGISEANWGTNIQFNIYKIDDNFPTSFSESDLIGSSQVKNVPYFTKRRNEARIILVDFQTPVVIPADVEMILVEVHKGIENGDGVAFVAGTALENDSSWYRGCNDHPSGNYATTQQLSNDIGGYWTEAFNFYVTVNGKAKTILPFEITNDNNCINFSNNFSLTNQAEIDNVIWNFDDPTSGANNTSIQINTTHQFSNGGIYNVTADVVHTNGTNYTITKEVEIFEAPVINKNVSLKQCDNADINGFSFFNLNEVKKEIITNPEDYTITFFEEKVDAENKNAPITNVTNYKNEQVSTDTIWARIENNNGCYEVSEVNLFVSTTQIPATILNSFYQCDDGTDTSDGIASFDFSSVSSEIENIFPINQQLIIKYYQNEADGLSELNEITNITNYQNTSSPNQQDIYIRVDSKVNNDCLGLGAHISLNVEKVPIANPVSINPECDNDRDGLFSFNTSNIHSTILGTQTNVSIRYFDETGIELISPLPNPYITASQTITARAENTLSQDPNGQCYEETTFNFTVNSLPMANFVSPQEKCDDDTDGVIGFDTSTIENTVLGSQTGLIVKYFDENNTELQSPLPNPFFTASQSITVRLENPVYDVCYEETTIDFMVREKPTFDLIEDGIICMTNNPQLEVSIESPSGNNTYTWKDENNVIISNLPTATFIKGGIYKVTATSIYGCNSEEKEVLIKESSSSTININDIEVEDDSDNNNIQINISNLGLGDYEFRLLDENLEIIRDYQDEPYFDNLAGGVYSIEVNDKNGCGTIPFEVSLLEFPEFFTPNNDGKNDFWQIKGISKNFYLKGEISIFDRYGNPVSKFTIDDIGWNGTYNGKILQSNDFWFYVELVDQKNISRNRRGNFSLLNK